MRLLITVIIVFVFISCNSGNNKPDVSGIKVELSLERFENDFFKIDTSDIPRGLTELNKKYPSFYPLFANDILLLNQDHILLPNGQVGLTPVGHEIMRRFISGYLPLYDSLREKYPNLNWLQEELEEAFKFIKYYYPDYNIPQVISFIGTFDAPGMILTPKYLGIGLHQYAGRNFSAYKDVEIALMYPQYISRRFDREYLLPNCMKAVAVDIYRDTTESGKLLELMIEKGKQWFLAEKFLPGTPDSLITGYTKAQTEWLDANEGNIWSSILQNTPDLYTVDLERVQNYIGEGPRTLGMPEQSPGNIGQWVGWRIIKKFADRNPDLNIQQIMATPFNTIFQEAKYKPK